MAEPQVPPSRAQVRQWRRNLAEERAEAAIYRDLAARSEGPDKAILLGLAQAECRHEAFWMKLLGKYAEPPPRRRPSSIILGFLVRRFGVVLALALAGRTEARSRDRKLPDAPASIAADEQIHSEVVRALAARGRARLSGSFRAAVFGANDGLVSNLALVLGAGGANLPSKVIMFTGIAGLLAGALSMAAGEYVSVRSQRELLAASRADPRTLAAAQLVDVDANELALINRARDIDQESTNPDSHEVVGSATKAAVASFCFFAVGAIIPVLPYLFGAQGVTAVIIAAAAVGLGLLATGAGVAILSGTSPLRKGLRQLGIGYLAAAVTYCLGLAFGTTLS
jgi:VIT1/CCC1 family predicted Fe2+/Mn2+ transporter